MSWIKPVLLNQTDLKLQLSAAFSFSKRQHSLVYVANLCQMYLHLYSTLQFKVLYGIIIKKKNLTLRCQNKS